MSSSFRILFESAFNVFYLVTIYILIFLMIKAAGNLSKENKGIPRLLIAGFALLALGDTGHVGFRVAAYLLGGLEAHAVLLGIGSMATAVTVTGLYLLFVEIWYKTNNKARGGLYFILMLTGLIRIALIFFPQNQWESIVPPFDWSLYRNIPLMLLGAGAAWLFFRAGEKKEYFRNMGILVAASYAFYLPVILFVQQVPLLGMLMIPKTLAYLGMAIVSLREIKRLGSL